MRSPGSKNKGVGSAQCTLAQAFLLHYSAVDAFPHASQIFNIALAIFFKAYPVRSFVFSFLQW